MSAESSSWRRPRSEGRGEAARAQPRAVRPSRARRAPVRQALPPEELVASAVIRIKQKFVELNNSLLQFAGGGADA